MNRCLCCNKALDNNKYIWHQSCIKKFFNTATLPIVDLKDYDYAFLNPNNKKINNHWSTKKIITCFNQ